MKRLGALWLGLLVVVPSHADADGKKPQTTKKQVADSDEEPDTPDEPEKTEPEKKPEKTEPEKKPGGFVKQDLTGHDLAGTSKSNAFEKDRFFVDKVDNEKTKNKTLVQGNLTSTTFGYTESSGNLPKVNGAQADANVPANGYSRIFTDLRLQTDFRHIGGSKADARVDVRGRVVGDPGSNTPNYVPATNSSSQSGLLGQNELEIREMWIMRGGKRTDFILGRQFVPDLAGVKFDGIRFDYASSEKFTLLGFGGLYPIRGSRSITTDYQPLFGAPDPMTGIRPSAGKFTGTGGFGAAYRTPNAYGAFGGVAIVPTQAEAPRIFGTSTGYWRPNPKVDIYHFGVIDVTGPNGFALTNLSGGLNYKPDQRLRGTLSFNRVDTETLNVQANAFLQDPNVNVNVVQNEAFLIRVAQNQARASLSAGLGSLQRIEITIASAFRYRGEVTLSAANQAGLVDSIKLPAGQSVEVYGGIVDRRSVANLRIGVDASRIIAVGGNTYQRATSNVFRLFTGRELKNGHGEWETELAFSQSKDDTAGAMGCAPGSLLVNCYGSSSSTAILAGGNLYYRFTRDWLLISSLFLTRQSVTSSNGMVGTPDPTITGATAFARFAYRF